MWQVKWLIVAALVYLLVSALVVFGLWKLKSPAWKSSLMTFYFTFTLSAWASCLCMYFCFWAGINAEFLRRASVGVPRDVATLKLIHKSNAKQVAPNQTEWVVKTLETEIDWLLPIADDYIRNRNSWKWRLQDKWYLGDMEPVFEREFPAVVEYRLSHPQVLERSLYEEVMRRYDKARQP